MYVDPERENRILSFELWRKEALRKEVTLAYKDNDEVKWHLANWRTSLFHKSGDPITTVIGKVTEVTINEPVSDSLFKPVFPVGTHVRKKRKDLQTGS